MRTRLLMAAWALALTALPARAGLYISAEPQPWPLPASPRQFRTETLANIQSIVSVDPEVMKRPVPTHVRDQVAKLQAKVRDQTATAEDRINLGGYLLLQYRADLALKALNEARKQAPRDFRLLANLANAYQATGEIALAVNYQSQALANWPRLYPGLTTAQLNWYRRVEQVYLLLLQARAAEQRGGRTETGLDPLFPGVKLDDPRASYRAGEIDPRTADRLPGDALAVVEQLLLWMPHDNRLLWQFAELLNVYGHVPEAATLMEELINARRFSNDVFRRHRAVLREGAMFLAEFTPDRRLQLLHALAPRSDLGSPAAAVAFEGGGVLVTDFLTNPGGRDIPPPPPTNPDPPADKDPSFLPAWQPLVVGFGSGLLVGVLAVLQLRQWRRKDPTLNESLGLSRTPVGAAAPADGSTDITSSPRPRPR